MAANTTGRLFHPSAARAFGFACLAAAMALPLPADEGDGQAPGAAPVVVPASHVSPPDSELPKSPERQLLERLRDAFAAVLSAEAHFSQTRFSDVFLETQEFEGVFYVLKPGKFRIDHTGNGEETRTLYLGTEAYIYIPAQAQVEKYALSGHGDSVEALNLSLLGFDLDVDKVFKVYRVRLLETDESVEGEILWTLRFEPLRPERSPLKLLEMALVEDLSAPEASAERFRPSKVYIEEVNGDTSEMRIESLAINEPLDPALLAPDYPSNVQIIHP